MDSVHRKPNGLRTTPFSDHRRTRERVAYGAKRRGRCNSSMARIGLYPAFGDANELDSEKELEMLKLRGVTLVLSCLVCVVICCGIYLISSCVSQLDQGASLSAVELSIQVGACATCDWLDKNYCYKKEHIKCGDHLTKTLCDLDTWHGGCPYEEGTMATAGGGSGDLRTHQCSNNFFSGACQWSAPACWTGTGTELTCGTKKTLHGC